MAEPGTRKALITGAESGIGAACAAHLAIPVIVNRSGGAAHAAGANLKDSLKQAFRQSGCEIDLHLLDGPQIAGAVGKAKAHRVIVAGGDGTAACAAYALRGSDTELGLLPLGTLNHLARDLRIPAKLEEAAALAATGQAVPVDLGEVNGRSFVNNASIGIYPRMVAQREAYRQRHGWPKWFATIPAGIAALARFPLHRLTIDMGQGPQRLITSLLFVGNNVYSLESGALGSRASLSDGVMSVFAVVHRSRLALVWFSIRTLLGRANQTKDFVAFGECTELTIDSRTSSVKMALDGELARLSFPLHFRIDPGALRIVCPPDAPADRPADTQ
ncbi:MAG: diacylglycerol kinase family protein [Novosphingobium sp.]